MELDPKTFTAIVFGLCYAGGVAMSVYIGMTDGMMRSRHGFAIVVVVSLLWPLALALAGLATAFLWWEGHKKEKACGKARGRVAPDAPANKKEGEDDKERVHGDGHELHASVGRHKHKRQGRHRRVRLDDVALHAGRPVPGVAGRAAAGGEPRVAQDAHAASRAEVRHLHAHDRKARRAGGEKAHTGGQPGAGARGRGPSAGRTGEQAGRGKVRLRLEQPCLPGMEEYA